MSVRIRAASLALAAAVLLAAGCSAPPPPGTPISREELAEIASALAETTPDLQGLRGSGSGTAGFAGRSFEFTFALAYDSPDWLRADLRPKIGSLSSTLTALFLWDRGCSRVYSPARTMEVRGCPAGPGEAFADLDYAAAFLGKLDDRVLGELEDATISTSNGGSVVRGTYRGMFLTVGIAGSPARISSLRIEDGETEISLRFAGHGWRSFDWFPETVEAAFVRDGREVVSASLVYKSARLTEETDRDAFTFDVPPDVKIVGWEELGLWRSE